MNKGEKEIHSCKLYVDGMHCAGCELLLEEKVKSIKGVALVKADKNKGTLIVKGDFKNPEQLAAKATNLVKEDGYIVHTDPVVKRTIKWADFIYALPIALTFILLFLLLQKSGIIKTDVKGVSYPVMVFIGFVGSFSSCMAVTGGLVLSISANFAKESRKFDRLKPHILFHAGRIISFFILGGVIGLIGSIFELTSKTAFILSLVVGTVMFVLGVNLLEIFDFTKKLQLKMPKFISRKALSLQNLENIFAPAILGAVTFFLPCGFTQSAQAQALSTQDMTKGALTMLAFVLGTLPVLGLISFASVNFAKSLQSSLFFKTAGLIVIFFAIINIINAFVSINLLPAIFQF